MPELQWEVPASDDLMVIIGHITEENPPAALALLEEIEGKVERLAEHPKSGRFGRVEGTRELVVRPNYIVVYAETLTMVRILRVLHAAQMWP